MKINEYTILFIVGATGSGKTYLSKYICENYNNHHLVISSTTRKPRINELNGEDFYFVNDEEFKKLNLFFKTDNYNGFKYGATKDQFKKDKINVFVIDINTVFEMYKKFPINNWRIVILNPYTDKLIKNLVKDHREHRIKLSLIEDKFFNKLYWFFLDKTKIKWLITANFPEIREFGKLKPIFYAIFYSDSCTLTLIFDYKYEKFSSAAYKLKWKLY